MDSDEPWADKLRKKQGYTQAAPYKLLHTGRLVQATTYKLLHLCRP